MLGLTPWTLYQRTYERRIAHVNMGSALWFRLSALERLIAKSKVPALKAATASVKCPQNFLGQFW